MELFEARVNNILKWMKGGKAPPVTIELVPTDRCNLNCLSCWRRGWPKEKLEERFREEMSDERLMQLIDEIGEIGAKEIAFVGGGEPLMRRNIFQIFKKMKTEYNMIGDLVTNGTLFTKNTIELMVRIKWDRIKFSIDAPNAKIHNFVRQTKGAFERTIKNIKLFSKTKKKYKSDLPKLILQSVLSTENYKTLPKLVKLANKIGINEMTLLPLTVFDSSMKHLKLNKKKVKELKPILLKAIELQKKFGIESNYHEFLKEEYILKTEEMDEVMMKEVEETLRKEYPYFKNKGKNFLFLPCYAPWIHITILPNGNIAPCFSPWVWNTNVSVKNHSLKELWYGKYFNNFRNILINRKLPENCKKCCVWEVFNNRKIREELRRRYANG